MRYNEKVNVAMLNAFRNGKGSDEKKLKLIKLKCQDFIVIDFKSQTMS